MQLKPRNQAPVMVHMLARHLLHLRTLLELVLTNRALVQLRVQQFIINGNRRKILDGVLGRRRSPVTIGIVFGELLNQLLEAGTEEVIADIGWEAKTGFGRVIDLELDVGAIGTKPLEMVLKEQERVEAVGFIKIGSGPGSGGDGEEMRVLEVDGGGRSGGG